ncbi:serine hydrolase domain-containing protein [Radiobacillus sp. PE A8.2]|uniref:serine hydrolase domain-containing protein n=1 Tax=Radiobacillus sp. PE A8.2 TaxID=3380349 RepID=UPI00389114E6
MREKVLQFLQKEIDLEHIPGAVISVSYGGKTVMEEAIGYRSVYPNKLPMSLDTVFDLASLTKIVATLPSILKLIDNGEIRLDDPISHFLPKFGQNGKEKITIRHLLTHTSGLPAHKSYYAENFSRNKIIETIFAEELDHSPDQKVVYSDLGLIMLYKVIEKVTTQPFEQFTEEQLFKPLNMLCCGYNPSFSRERYAATEYSEKLNEYKCGVVHDENTEAMGGISGHAGLFSTIKDLQNYAKMIENGGEFEGKQILSNVALALSKQNHTPFDTEYRGLGWVVKGQKLPACGDLFSSRSYGHTGFTGTSIWFDPDIDLHVILLTNRVHYGRQPHILRLRPRLHNIIRSYC